MTEVLVGPQDDAVEISVAGDLTINGIHELHRQVLAALEYHRPITVRVDQVSAFDLPGVQLCLALQRTGAVRGTPVTFSGTATVERFNRMLSYVGLPEV